MLSTGQEIPPCLSPPLSRLGLGFSSCRDALPAPPQLLVLLEQLHPHHANLVDIGSYFPQVPLHEFSTQDSVSREPETSLTSETLCKQGALVLILQIRTIKSKTALKRCPVVSLAPAGLPRAQGQQKRGREVGGPGKPGRQKVQAGLAVAVKACRGR